MPVARARNFHTPPPLSSILLQMFCHQWWEKSVFHLPSLSQTDTSQARYTCLVPWRRQDSNCLQHCRLLGFILSRKVLLPDIRCITIWLVPSGVSENQRQMGNSQFLEENRKTSCYLFSKWELHPSYWVVSFPEHSKYRCLMSWSWYRISGASWWGGEVVICI